MSATRTALTLEDLEAALADDRHNGWGYATRDSIESQSRLERLNKSIVFVANEMGMDYNALFHWTDSKWGRWLIDGVYGRDESPSRATVRKYLNDAALDSLDGLAQRVGDGWVGFGNEQNALDAWIKSGGHLATEPQNDDAEAEEEPTREFLVHLNIQVPAEADVTVEQIVADLNGVIAVGVDAEYCPSLAQAKVEVAFAEEI